MWIQNSIAATFRALSCQDLSKFIIVLASRLDSKCVESYNGVSFEGGSQLTIYSYSAIKGIALLAIWWGKCGANPPLSRNCKAINASQTTHLSTQFRIDLFEARRTSMKIGIMPFIHGRVPGQEQGLFSLGAIV